MNSIKSILFVAIFALLGALVIHSTSLLPSVAFLIGAVGSALMFIVTSPTKASSVGEPDVNSVNDSPSTTTLYVGNLPYKANESLVKELFSEYGEVFAVRLMKDKKTGKRRGFGFVVMAESAAQHTIDSLNEFDYQGRTLKVRVANDPKDKPESDD